MSHRCRGPSCYRTLGVRNECPSCNRSANNRRMKRIFERLPKSSHWRQAAHKHLGEFGLTPVIISETLEAPDEVELQTKVRNTPTAFYKFYPKGSRETVHLGDASEGGWFRVVLDSKGALYTAFRDHQTERNGGRQVCPTPNTTLNHP